MNSITITYGSTTQSIQDWGFTYCRLRLRSRAASTLILDTAGGDPAADAAIPYGAWITVVIAMGDGSNYTFYGKRRDFDARAYPDAPATSMMFEDVWGALSRTIFQHYWSMLGESGELENTYFSRLMLYQDISAGPDSEWAYLTADKQIEQIIDFAREQCAVPVQYGEVDPVWNMPVFQVKAISCAEALQYVLKPMPDMVTSIDYSTTLAGSPCPTINFRQRQNCAPITLPFAGTDAYGRNHKQSTIKPRPDLQVPSVNVQYQITGTYDGSGYDDLGTDNYPLDSTGLAENALVFPVDLRGPSNTLVKATVHTVAIDPTTTGFWQTNKPDLNDPNIINPSTGLQGFQIVDTAINESGHPDGITILDGAGAQVDLTGDDAYPNKLLPSGGNLAPWMLAGDGSPLEAVPVTIRATIAYQQKDPNTGQIQHDVLRQVVETRITLTDAPAGTTTYTTVGSEDSGDPIPTGLAYFMWCSVNNVAVNYVDGVASPPESAPSLASPENLQWEGEHQMVEDTIYSMVTPANTLNISGGNSDWAEMNAAIYAVDYDFFKGHTSIQFGPHKHLQAAEYFEMVMAFRYRTVYDNPNVRNNGTESAGGGTDLGNAQAKENTTHQNPQLQKHTVVSKPDGSGNVINIQQDATTNGGQILLQTLTSAGSVATALPQVQLTQNDLGYINDDSGSGGRVATWTKVVMFDTSGNLKQFIVPASGSEDTDVTIAAGAPTKGTINTVSGNPDIYGNYFIINTGSVTTTATFSGSASSITVANATGIAVGQVVSGTNIPAQTTVTSVSGTTIGISNATTGGDSGNYTFTSLIRVAKNPKLRTAISYEEIDGNYVYYSYGASSPYTYVSREASVTVSGTSYTEYQVIVPRFLTGDQIWAVPATTGVTSVSDTISSTSGGAIDFLDLNVDGRAWCLSVTGAYE